MHFYAPVSYTNFFIAWEMICTESKKTGYGCLGRKMLQQGEGPALNSQNLYDTIIKIAFNGPLELVIL